jgi:4-hydroxybenzoate polyprenyltransferase
MSVTLNPFTRTVLYLRSIDPWFSNITGHSDYREELAYACCTATISSTTLALRPPTPTMTKTIPSRMIETSRSVVPTSADLKTVYLFVRNYNAIIIMWSTIGAICSRRLTRRQYGTFEFPGIIPYLSTELPEILQSILLPVIWVTLVTISFSISNQRQPSSIKEDTLNKPYRPIPSGRITPQRATVFLMVSNILGFAFSWAVGANKLFLFQMVVSYMYNDMGGGDSHYAIRDTLNGLGLTTWAFGATSAAKGLDVAFSNADLVAGMVMILAIATTNGIQDFRDLYGDRKCGRGTFPLLVGESRARYILAMAVLTWSFGIVPTLHVPLLSIQTVLGIIIACRLVLFRKCKSDRLTTEIWYAWSAMLPLTLIR